DRALLQHLQGSRGEAHDRTRLGEERRSHAGHQRLDCPVRGSLSVVGAVRGSTQYPVPSRRISTPITFVGLHPEPLHQEHIACGTCFGTSWPSSSVPSP